MGYLPSSLGSKAAHFVTDVTTAILNPISDEPSRPPVVGDKKGVCFGGLVEVPFHAINMKKYQVLKMGTNNGFVFIDLSGNPVIFHPTGSNCYFTSCSSDYLSRWGAHFALQLGGDLLNGSSSSETFGNSCLAHTEEFEVKEVELWNFAYALQ